MKLIKRAIALTLLFMVAAVPVAGAATVEDFSFKDINGQTHRFSDYRGKWVVVNYWATYCGPCLEELPALNGAAKRFKDKLVILGMEAGETPTLFPLLCDAPDWRVSYFQLEIAQRPWTSTTSILKRRVDPSPPGWRAFWRC